MAEYIERESLLKEAESRIMWGASAAAVYELIRDAPAADVVPVRHGRWEWSKNGWICDNCDGLNNRFTKFCPNCGATMDGCDGNSDMA